MLLALPCGHTIKSRRQKRQPPLMPRQIPQQGGRLLGQLLRTQRQRELPPDRLVRLLVILTSPPIKRPVPVLLHRHERLGLHRSHRHRRHRVPLTTRLIQPISVLLQATGARQI